MQDPEQHRTVYHQFVRQIPVRKQKVTFWIRFSAILLCPFCIMILFESLHALLHGPWESFTVVQDLIFLSAASICFWPVSYVAVKGRLPDNWHPYTD